MWPTINRFCLFSSIQASLLLVIVLRPSDNGEAAESAIDKYMGLFHSNLNLTVVDPETRDVMVALFELPPESKTTTKSRRKKGKNRYTWWENALTLGMINLIPEPKTVRPTQPPPPPLPKECLQACSCATLQRAPTSCRRPRCPPVPENPRICAGVPVCAKECWLRRIDLDQDDKEVTEKPIENANSTTTTKKPKEETDTTTTTEKPEEEDDTTTTTEKPNEDEDDTKPGGKSGDVKNSTTTEKPGEDKDEEPDEDEDEDEDEGDKDDARQLLARSTTKGPKVSSTTKKSEPTTRRSKSTTTTKKSQSTTSRSNSTTTTKKSNSTTTTKKPKSTTRGSESRITTKRPLSTRRPGSTTATRRTKPRSLNETQTTVKATGVTTIPVSEPTRPNPYNLEGVVRYYRIIEFAIPAKKDRDEFTKRIESLPKIADFKLLRRMLNTLDNLSKEKFPPDMERLIMLGDPGPLEDAIDRTKEGVVSAGLKAILGHLLEGQRSKKCACKPEQCLLEEDKTPCEASCPNNPGCKINQCECVKR